MHCARVRRQASGHSQLRLPAVFGDLHHQQRTHGLFHADYAVYVPPSPHPLCNKVLGTRLSVRLEEGEVGRGNGAAASAATIAPCYVPKAPPARASVIKQCTHYYMLPRHRRSSHPEHICSQVTTKTPLSNPASLAMSGKLFDRSYPLPYQT